MLKGERKTMSILVDSAWEHAKVVADRCEKRFSSRTEIERYLLGIGWDAATVERMLKYLDRKRKDDAQ